MTYNLAYLTIEPTFSRKCTFHSKNILIFFHRCLGRNIVASSAEQESLSSLFIFANSGREVFV